MSLNASMPALSPSRDPTAKGEDEFAANARFVWQKFRAVFVLRVPDKSVITFGVHLAILSLDYLEFSMLGPICIDHSATFALVSLRLQEISS